MNPAMMGGGEQIPPEILEALMGQMGGGEAPVEAPAAEPTLADAINLVHQLMVSSQDPQEVSLLGAVLNQLTTAQAKRASG